jgi:hypothetical protein
MGGRLRLLLLCVQLFVWHIWSVAAMVKSAAAVTNGGGGGGGEMLISSKKYSNDDVEEEEDRRTLFLQNIPADVLDAFRRRRDSNCGRQPQATAAGGRRFNSSSTSPPLPSPTPPPPLHALLRELNHKIALTFAWPTIETKPLNEYPIDKCAPLRADVIDGGEDDDDDKGHLKKTVLKRSSRLSLICTMSNKEPTIFVV